MTDVTSYEACLHALAGEVEATMALLDGLQDAAWRQPTRLPGWDVLTLVAHIVGSLQVIDTYAATPIDEPPAITRTTYYRFDPAEVSPGVDARARAAAQGQTPETMRAALRAATTAAFDRLRATRETTIIPTRRGSMRCDDFLATRVVEAVIHGLDLRAAIGAPPTPTPAALRSAAAFLDAMLDGSRPPDLADDVAFVEVATGRRRHPDPRFPLLQ
jgi:uncharacterized protein (TIGR03083 family)